MEPGQKKRRKSDKGRKEEGRIGEVFGWCCGGKRKNMARRPWEIAGPWSKQANKIDTPCSESREKILNRCA
jgi:hypothetical protein